MKTPGMHAPFTLAVTQLNPELNALNHLFINTGLVENQQAQLQGDPQRRDNFGTQALVPILHSFQGDEHYRRSCRTYSEIAHEAKVLRTKSLHMIALFLGISALFAGVSPLGGFAIACSSVGLFKLYINFLDLGLRASLGDIEVMHALLEAAPSTSEANIIVSRVHSHLCNRLPELSQNELISRSPALALLAYNDTLPAHCKQQMEAALSRNPNIKSSFNKIPETFSS